MKKLLLISMLLLCVLVTSCRLWAYDGHRISGKRNLTLEQVEKRADWRIRKGHAYNKRWSNRHDRPLKFKSKVTKSNP